MKKYGAEAVKALKAFVNSSGAGEAKAWRFHYWQVGNQGLERPRFGRKGRLFSRFRGACQLKAEIGWNLSESSCQTG